MKIDETILIILCLLTAFGTGIIVGNDNATYKAEENELGYQQINYTGTLNRHRYKFVFQEEIEVESSDSIINGAAYPSSSDKTIKLRTNRRAEEMLKTCRHEILHYYFPHYEHPDFTKTGVFRANDPIYRLSDKVDFGVCEDVLATALIRQR